MREGIHPNYQDCVIKCACGETTEVLVESVKITGKAEMSEGEEQTLSLTVLPAYATNKEVLWTSSDETIATVNSEGIITGVSKGTVTITIEDELTGASGAKKITVK